MGYGRIYLPHRTPGYLTKKNMLMNQTQKTAGFPPQTQETQPGDEYKMEPRPEYIRENYRGSGKLTGKTALISGGDSGIGRAVAIHFAREGADIGIIYLNEDKDADLTRSLVQKEGSSCLLLRGDISDQEFCEEAVDRFVEKFSRIDILVNNAAQQFPTEELEALDDSRMKKTFEVNIFAQFYLTRAGLKYIPDGGRVINTTSVTAYRGSKHLMDYASTKGAIVSFTRSLAQNLAEKKILVNAVAPGPIWTPLIPATFGEDKVSSFGKNVLLERAGQPAEVAPAYVFLASQDSSYVTGQVLHVNGGEIVGG